MYEKEKELFNEYIENNLPQQYSLDVFYTTLNKVGKATLTHKIETEQG